MMTEQEFKELRRSAFAIAYRMLGSVSEAEDVVQKGFLRLFRVREDAMSTQERTSIKSPGACLNAVASRICLDQLTSARARRESYAGEWIPEPLPEPAIGTATTIFLQISARPC